MTGAPGSSAMASATGSWISIAGFAGSATCRMRSPVTTGLPIQSFGSLNTATPARGDEHVRARQLRRHRRPFRAALLRLAVEHGQLVLALRVVEGALAGRDQFGIRDGDLPCQHFDAAVQRRLVEREQQRARLHRPGWAARHPRDHAVDRRADDARLARDDLGRRQHGLPHRHAAAARRSSASASEHVPARSGASRQAPLRRSSADQQ